jgi:phage shock protein PspC (stress-responsive transcriptional regulator)
MATGQDHGQHRSMPHETSSPETSNQPNIPTPRPVHPAQDRFFAWLRGLGIMRSPGWIGGVATGIADRLGIDPLIVRGILVVAAVLGAPATLLYAIAWLLLPDTKGKIHLEELIRGRVDSPIVGIGILFAISLLPVTQGVWSLGAAYWGQGYWGDSIGRAIWTLVILGLLVWLVVWFVRRSDRTSLATASAATTSATTIPSAGNPATDVPPTNERAESLLHSTAAMPNTVSAPAAPPRPAPDASTEDVAAWRDRQVEWKLQYDAYRRQQSAERQVASQAAAAEARSERLARSAVYREARARSRSNPLYSLALVGIALVGGAITTLLIGAGEPSALQFLTGISVAVGILAIGIVVNGIRGKRAGGASAVAILLAIPLLLAGIFPPSDTLRYSGAWNLTPSLASGGTYQRFVEGFGPVTIDLRDYYSGSSAGGGTIYSSVDLVVASGDVTVIMPPTDSADPAGITVHTGRGSITTDTGVHLTGDRAQGWGTNVSLKEGQKVDHQLDVSINAGSGNITVINAPTDSE